eukprot:CAMPEP_0181293778 /NCGR_PEP_ID=MMETSP1101-20121128/3243_1 /TAXON_ID=46948 /ORGANISM="Rhodomonas abbreviata, Strain Caron Lab Isolate" /LENGTH=95 /DNA_ID=CAMNT_0023398381 /DNA_START=89 /DNA_END=376 /DNA_ORIENTATION=+
MAGGNKVYPPTHPRHGISKDNVRSAVRHSLARIGVSPVGFSGISMRQGGVSAAVLDGIPADLRMLQTGHSSSAWLHYGVLSERDELYSFHGSFQL